MRSFIVALVALAFVSVAHAAPVTMVSRDVFPASEQSRSLAAALPRFNLVALHWQGSGVPLFRAHHVEGGWGPWQAADDDWGRGGAWRKQGVPSWVGASDAIQYRLRGRVTRVRAYFIWSGPEPQPSRRLSLAGSPNIVPRSGWAADETIRRAAPVYADAVRYALVHHTVNANDYTPAQSASIVHAIEVYHVRGNGWNDIGYNFLVDQYGQVFEGRYGGIDKAVVGAHSAGFNTGSVGIAVIGTYSKVAISVAAKKALEQLLAWRLDVAHVDPLSSVVVTSGGNSKFPAGTQVTLRAISGHRDTYLTDCPGNALYAQLPSIARDVAALGLPKLYSPTVTGRIGGPIRFTARLSGPLPWTVTITDVTGKTVATGTGVGTAVDWTWDATAAPVGGYAWTISAGPVVRPAKGSLGAKPVTLTISNATAVPPTTSTTSEIAYTLSAPATVTATLVDATGSIAVTLFSGTAQQAGKQTFTFTVPPALADGAYTIQLVAVAADGTQATTTVPIQVDRTVLDFSVAPAAISPNGDGIQDALTLYFDLARPATATVTLVRFGKPLAAVASGAYAAATPVTATWDGTVAGQPVPDGAYALTLTIGKVAHTLPVVVDRKAPSLRPISWTHLRFAVGEPSTISLVVGVKTYVKQAKAAGYVYFWLKTPPLHYVVRAQDAAGNVTTLKR